MPDFLLRGAVNQLLKSLPIAEYSRFHRYLEPVKLAQGEVIQQSGAPVKYVYFPQSCVIALLTVFRNGTSVESGIVGAEGAAGISSALLKLDASREAQVLAAGQCLRIKAEVLRALFSEPGVLQSLTQKYLCAFNEQVAQLGACNGYHPLQQRIARLLLLCSQDKRVPVTQETLALMLGVHRPSVSKIALKLKKKNLIDYVRGALWITDQEGLQAEACECYESISSNYSAYQTELKKQPVKLLPVPAPVAVGRLPAADKRVLR